MTLDLAVNYGYDMKGTGIKKIDKLEFMKTFKFVCQKTQQYRHWGWRCMRGAEGI